jgi:hypothetical protein
MGVRYRSPFACHTREERGRALRERGWAYGVWALVGFINGSAGEGAGRTKHQGTAVGPVPAAMRPKLLAARE